MDAEKMIVNEITERLRKPMVESLARVKEFREERDVLRVRVAELEMEVHATEQDGISVAVASELGTQSHPRRPPGSGGVVQFSFSGSMELAGHRGRHDKPQRPRRRP